MNEMNDHSEELDQLRAQVQRLSEEVTQLLYLLPRFSCSVAIFTAP